MGDSTDEMLAAKAAKLAVLADSLSASGGPHYAALAQMAALAEEIAELGTDRHKLAASIAASLARVLTYPLHDHPQFPALIDVHASALARAATTRTGIESKRGQELMLRIEKAVGLILPA